MLRTMEPFLALDGFIILELELDVKNFFSSHFFFCQGEWIRLTTYPILDEPIIP